MRFRAAMVGLVCFPVLLAAQAVLYVTSGNGNRSALYTVDPQTMQSTLVGNVMLGESWVTVTALAFHPGTNALYGVSGSEYTPSRVLMTIDPQTAVATAIGVIGTSSNQNASDIAFAANGSLYGWTTRGGPFMQLDAATAARTAIGSATNGTRGNGLTFTPDGNLYLVGPTTGSVFRVDTTTGALTAVATLSGAPSSLNVTALTSDANGLLYATLNGSSALVTINVSTGVVTTLGSLSFGEADALAFRPVPEPSVLALLASGLALFAWARRRRLARF